MFKLDYKKFQQMNPSATPKKPCSSFAGGHLLICLHLSTKQNIERAYFA